MDMELMWDGVKAMILGMAMVYLFLTIMIWVMKLTSKLLAPYAERFEPKRENTVKKAPASAMTDEKIAKAAAAAVDLFRKNGKSPACVQVDGKTVSVDVVAGVKTAPAAAPVAAPVAAPAAGDIQVLSPLPGTIVRVAVAAGDTVSAGDVLAVIEAMKMETEIRAEKDGIVSEVLVNAKDVVTSEQPIMILGGAK